MPLKRVAVVGGVPGRMVVQVVGVDIRYFGSARDVGDGELRRLQHAIANGAFDLVVVAVRFGGHSMCNGVRDACKRAGLTCWVRPCGASGIAAELKTWNRRSDDEPGSP